MNIAEVIKKRRSCRSYDQEILKSSDKKILEDFIKSNVQNIGNEKAALFIVEKEKEDKIMKLDYGMIEGHCNYIIGTCKSSIISRLNFGYVMEKVVLKATEANISSCWIGYFDKDYFTEVTVDPGFEIPSIVVVGYPKEKSTLKEKVVRFSLNATKRANWEQLFFNYKFQTPLQREAMEKYGDCLEMVRLAPSTGNTQPWRIYFDELEKEFHFYKKPISKSYELKGLHDIDMGIALSHFELMCDENHLAGRWIEHSNESILPIGNLQYMMTWKCK